MRSMRIAALASAWLFAAGDVSGAKAAITVLSGVWDRATGPTFGSIEIPSPSQFAETLNLQLIMSEPAISGDLSNIFDFNENDYRVSDGAHVGGSDVRFSDDFGFTGVAVHWRGLLNGLTQSEDFVKSGIRYVYTSTYRNEIFARFDTDGPVAWTLTIDSLRISATPEPSTWAMLVTGFAGLGASLRLRCRQARRSA